MKAFSPSWYANATPGMLEPDKEAVGRAKVFLLAKWRERAAERGDGVPVDLSRACKFSSLFTKIVFGGSIAGNRDHQFVVSCDGSVIDLNAEARDVVALPHAYRAEPGFIGNDEHHLSMKSCVPRVKKWAKEFLAAESARGTQVLLPEVPSLRGVPAPVVMAEVDTVKAR